MFTKCRTLDLLLELLSPTSPLNSFKFYAFSCNPSDGNLVEADRDIFLEKFLEMLYDQMKTRVPSEAKNKCPILECMADLLVAMKSENNREMALEFGILAFESCKDAGCPCKFKKTDSHQ